VRACDVHVVVRGLQPVRRTPGQAHVLWVISHPESITAQECDDADLVLVASHRFADELRARTRTPVEVMLQATDTDRFRPRPVDPQHAHDVAVVAKSRDVFRPAVAAAVAGGLRPAIYGSGWEPFVDRELLVRDYVANDELPIVYSSVGVLLNDQWETMQTWGFVSNRVFDALACETPVISEDLPEIAELFDGAVLTFHDGPELRALVDDVLADRAAARARAARGRALIEARHTFDHRAAQLIDALHRHGLARP
jgi:spore maturation protein CgeB